MGEGFSAAGGSMTGAVHFVCTYHVYAGKQQWRSCGEQFASLGELIEHRETAHDTPRQRRPALPRAQRAAGQRVSQQQNQQRGERSAAQPVAEAKN